MQYNVVRLEILLFILLCGQLVDGLVYVIEYLIAVLYSDCYYMILMKCETLDRILCKKFLECL